MQRQRPLPGTSKRVKEGEIAPGSGRSMGRPPLPREVARSKRVVTFVTEPEKASLELLAEVTSLSLSAVCHRLIAQGLERDERTKAARPPQAPTKGRSS